MTAGRERRIPSNLPAVSNQQYRRRRRRRRSLTQIPSHTVEIPHEKARQRCTAAPRISAASADQISDHSDSVRVTFSLE